MTKPNMVVIMADQLAPQFTGAYGHPIAKTPHLDALARRGMRFNAAYCNSPLCAPSRFSFMSGQLISRIAADLGVILDPAIVEAQLTGAAIYGLSAAIQGEITFANGAVEQGNFPDYDALRMHNTPRFHVTLLQNNRRMGGAGEPGTPPAAPALANAIFNLTGKRLREMPFSKHIGFLT